MYQTYHQISTGTIDLILFYSHNSYGSKLIGYADPWYLSDSHKVWS